MEIGGRRRVIALAVAAILAVAGGLGIVTLLQDAAVPEIALAQEHRLGSSLYVEVESAEPRRALSEFHASLSLDGADVDALPSLSGQAADVMVYEDADSDGRVSAGDRFRIDPPEAGGFSLDLFFRDSRAAGREWRLVPEVALGAAAMGTSNVTVEVSAAWPVHPLADYAATLSDAGGTIASLPTLDASAPGKLSFDDRDGDGRLSLGDRFLVDEMRSGVSAIVLTWRGETVAGRSWEPPTASPPQVTFMPPEPIAVGTWRVYVASASETHPLGLFDVEVRNGSIAAIPATGLDAVASSGASGDGLTLDYLDLGGAGYGNLTPGDRFTLSGCTSGNAYELRLLWRPTGAVVATVTIDA